MTLRNAPVTIVLIVANLAVFAWDQFSPTVRDLGVHRVMLQGAVIAPLIAHGQYYRLFTAGFLHFSLTHIAFNMYALLQAGMAVENLYGSGRFVAIYLIALLAGNVVAYETSEGITAGASGAIMGLFGAMAALGLKTPGLGRTLLNWAAFPIIATLAVGFTTPGISNAAHIGGVVAGAIVGFVLPAARLRRAAQEPEDVY